MRHTDVEQLRDDIAKMKKAKNKKQANYDVDDAYARELASKCAPLYKYLVAYTQLCNKANAVLPANKSKIEPYRSNLKQIKRAKGNGILRVYACAMLSAVDYLCGLSDLDDEEKPEIDEHLRRLMLYIQFAKQGGV
jgi:hypothetical protein